MVWRFQREVQCGWKVDSPELLGKQGIFHGGGDGLVIDEDEKVLILPGAGDGRIAKEVRDAGILQTFLDPWIVEKPQHFS
jgi:hypothetical protein